MIIRESTQEDITGIISLLKQSIGELLTPKTAAYFLWKHEQNPFGRSKVLLAVEDERIIGLRAFMRWRWESGNEIVNAVRAVDTSTDPDFQGKGIFKTLTLEAVAQCKNEGLDMVFNSPNPVSMQGYLKMGWSAVGRLPLYIGPGSLFPRPHAGKTFDKFYEDYPVKTALKNIDTSWSLPPSTAFLHTPVNYQYLNWRYANCPVAKYGAVIEPGKFGFIFRLKKINRFIELRICEVWSESGQYNSRPAKKAFKKLVKKIRPAVVSCAYSPLFLSGKKKITALFGPFKKGPVITIRPLTKDNLNNFEQFSTWKPSLGSMELF